MKIQTEHYIGEDGKSMNSDQVALMRLEQKHAALEQAHAALQQEHTSMKEQVSQLVKRVENLEAKNK
jgi:predicted  nucleic acid-binding Zn-ribbon protein